jgi:hypothetical protein
MFTRKRRGRLPRERLIAVLVACRAAVPPPGLIPPASGVGASLERSFSRPLLAPERHSRQSRSGSSELITANITATPSGHEPLS